MRSCAHTTSGSGAHGPDPVEAHLFGEDGLLDALVHHLGLVLAARVPIWASKIIENFMGAYLLGGAHTNRRPMARAGRGGLQVVRPDRTRRSRKGRASATQRASEAPATPKAAR